MYRFVRSLPLGWIINGREGAFIRDEDKSLDNHSEISEMKSLRLKSPKNIFFSYLNINSVWNKFKNMSSLISGKCWHFDSGRDDITTALSKEFLDSQAAIECGFTLKRVRDIIITYSQICHSKWKKWTILNGHYYNNGVVWEKSKKESHEQLFQRHSF